MSNDARVGKFLETYRGVVGKKHATMARKARSAFLIALAAALAACGNGSARTKNTGSSDADVDVYELVDDSVARLRRGDDRAWIRTVHKVRDYLSTLPQQERDRIESGAAFKRLLEAYVLDARYERVYHHMRVGKPVFDILDDYLALMEGVVHIAPNLPDHDARKAMLVGLGWVIEPVVSAAESQNPRLYGLVLRRTAPALAALGFE